MDDSKKKILVVEDEKSISDIIRYNLEKEGFSVYAAYDGEEGPSGYFWDTYAWLSK